MSRGVAVPAADGTSWYSLSGARPVFIAALWPATPVFHSLQLFRSGRTDCGLDAGRPWGGHWVPVRHAVRFGRPCQRCYP